MDITDKSWVPFFSKEEIEEISNFSPKPLPKLPTILSSYIDSLKQIKDMKELKRKLMEETGCSACDWVRYTMLGYIKLFKFNYLPLTGQTEGDLMRKIWFFVDTVFDASPINCRR